MVWRELLTGTSTVGGKEVKARPVMAMWGEASRGIAPFLLSPTPSTPKKDPNSQMKDDKTLQNTGSMNSIPHGWEIIIRPRS